MLKNFVNSLDFLLINSWDYTRKLSGTKKIRNCKMLYSYPIHYVSELRIEFAFWFTALTSIDRFEKFFWYVLQVSVNDNCCFTSKLGYVLSFESICPICSVPAVCHRFPPKFTAGTLPIWPTLTDRRIHRWLGSNFWCFKIINFHWYWTDPFYIMDPWIGNDMAMIKFLKKLSKTKWYFVTYSYIYINLID